MSASGGSRASAELHIKLQAHRGASHAAPENTLRAFELAIAEGADAIELDVRLSADEVPVVFHDDDLQRMADEHGRVSHTPWSMLRVLSVRGEPIPLLAEVIAFALERAVPLNIELKPSPRPQALVAACEPHLARLSTAGCGMVSSFDPRALAILHQRLPALPLALIFDDPRALAALKLLPAVDLHPRHDLIDAARLPEYLQSPRALRAWTVDDPVEARRLAALRHPRDPERPAIDALITNRPGPLRVELGDPEPTGTT